MPQSEQPVFASVLNCLPVSRKHLFLSVDEEVQRKEGSTHRDHWKGGGHCARNVIVGFLFGGWIFVRNYCQTSGQTVART